MVRVILYNLLRSKYGIKEESVSAGSIHNIIQELITKHPAMKQQDFDTAIVFRDGTPIHPSAFHTTINDGEDIIFTHFVGGG